MEIVFPGTYLGLSTEFKLGSGVYEEGGKLYAGIAGKASTYTNEDGSKRITIDSSVIGNYLLTSDIYKDIMV